MRLMLLHRKITFRVLLTIALAALFCTGAFAGRVIVKYAEPASLSAGAGAMAESAKVARAMSKYHARVVSRAAMHAKNAGLARKIGLDRTWIIESPDPAAFCRELSSLGGVEYAEPVRRVHPAYTPNDTYFSTQWALNNTGQGGGLPDADIDAPEAWDITKGSSTVVVAVIDTGVDLTHLDLSARIVAGYDFANQDTDPQDDYGHGTRCAGVAAAIIGNSRGIAGVCGYAKIMPLKVMDNSGTGEDAWVGDALIWAADHGANVASLSLILDDYSAYVEDATNYALASGVTVVAAMGNDYSEFVRYPAAYEGVIAVGSTDRRDAHSIFSTYGSHIAVVAPGEGIYSTDMGNAYTYFTGTSAATPHVAGLAALLLSLNPNLRPADVLRLVKLSADDKGDPGFDIYYGAGRINARRALLMAYETVANVKARPDTSLVTLYDKTVTAVFSGFFYVQDADRSSGIRVNSSAAVQEGWRVNVVGTMTTTGGERAIQATSIEIMP